MQTKPALAPLPACRLPQPLIDGHGRPVHYLRLSVTDRCNLHCLYCRNLGRQQFIPHPQILRYEEIVRLVGLMSAGGVTKLRLTGGEPFVRRGCEHLLVMLRERFPQLDLRLTSNGTLLEPHVPLLRRLGLGAVNLSLDSFDRQTFAQVTGHDLLPAVLSALDALLAAGIRVKINAVAMRGINDRQLDDFIHAARSLPVDVRFIEFMPIGAGTHWSPESFWPAAEIFREVAARVALAPEQQVLRNAGPARMYRVLGGRGRLGFIAAVSNHFCASCNRLRLTCNGNLRTCLFDDHEYRLRGLLRHQACDDAQLARVLRLACLKKPVGAELLRNRPQGQAVAGTPMAAIGG